ncbi:MAG: hypothetical protein KKH08_06510 [Candidatus Omnitrophica bacterium]|nr:hypothetical protein [Candidatus Omnitrophota bacterium]
MIPKEKLIFWSLAAVFIGILVFGFISQGSKDEAARDLSKEIELATRKSKARKKTLKGKPDIAVVKTGDKLDSYNELLKRSPFFRVIDESKIKKAEAISVKTEKPKKAILKYKGKVMIGQKVMVVIEDVGTGKSFFAQEGDMAGDFLVLRIDDKEVTLKKKGGEEIVLGVDKKEQETRDKGQGIEDKSKSEGGLK